MFTHKIHDDENLLQIYRKHEITLVPKVLQIFVLIFIPWFFGLKYNFVFASQAHVKIFLAWTILVAFYALHAFMLWAINVYMLTTKRLLHIQHTGFFKKFVTETPLDRILNVSFSTSGFFSTIFHYGDVHVQIVGLEHPIVLNSVPNPSDVKDFIWKLHHTYGGDQKITYTQPEIVSVDKEIPYAPRMAPRIIRKDKNGKIL
jgi:hypothetical protein